MDKVTRRAFIEKCVHSAGAMSMGFMFAGLKVTEQIDENETRELLADIYCAKLEHNHDKIQIMYHGSVIERVSEETKKRWKNAVRKMYDECKTGSKTGGLI